jgi:MoxR-like ATPase
MMDYTEFADRCDRVVGQVERAVIGKREFIENLLVAVLASGHILIEDVPGLAKTLVARSFSQVLDVSFSRIQFTPDLLPGDITGGTVYNRSTESFDFLPGAIFASLILADEINRASPKTQSALLEAMQEGQITIDGKRHALEEPFLVFATQNPIEFEGTYPLPEAQLDRFIMKLGIGYPSAEDELEILLQRQKRKSDEVELEKIASREEVLAMQQAVENVYISPEIGEYMVSLVRATREDRRVQVGASPRGSLALFKLSRAVAAIQGRDFVTPEDVKRIAVQGLAHRIILRPEVWTRNVREEEVVKEALDNTPVPGPLEQE